MLRDTLESVRQRRQNRTLTTKTGTTTMNGVKKAHIQVSGLKVAVPLQADQLPAGLVPPEGQPAGEPVIELALEGSPVTVTARLNGKNYRKMLKTVGEHGADHVVVVLQGTLKPGPQSGTLILESAGFQVNVKTPKPAAPE